MRREGQKNARQRTKIGKLGQTVERSQPRILIRLSRNRGRLSTIADAITHPNDVEGSLGMKLAAVRVSCWPIVLDAPRPSQASRIV